MSKVFIVIIGLFFFHPCFSQGGGENTNPNGYNKFYYDNGKISSEGTLKNGKPEGYWKTYYPNGNLKTEGNRKEFKLDSVWKFYGEDGKLQTTITYREDRKEGVKISFDPEGRMVLEERYEKNLRHGISTAYYPNGKIKSTVPFDKGKEEGTAFEYDGDGNVTRMVEYTFGFMKDQQVVNRKDGEGRKTGMWKEFYPDWKIKNEATYLEGKKNGYYKEFDTNGQLLNVYKYFMDSLIKDAPELAKLDVKTEYYEDGTKKYEGTFKDGKPEGIHNLFSPEGVVIKTKVYTEGILSGAGIMDAAGNEQGPWEEFHANGQLKGKGEYKDGKRIGDWSFYHINGKLEQKGKYDKKGRAQGVWKWYYEGGNLLREENYLDGQREGAMTEYSDSGSVITRGDFLEGMKEGKWEYCMGDYKESGEYKGGQMSGEWNAWFISNKQLKWKVSFVDGNPDGKYKEYTIGGQPLREGKYVMGTKDGDWRYWGYNEETGALEYILTITYKDGKETKWDNFPVKPFTE
ncbi:MAG: hypothetical protein IT233_13850 [Bacteroidia bacterium]|nr:hypothetical protein [Bacteroidia bacterium]